MHKNKRTKQSFRSSYSKAQRLIAITIMLTMVLISSILPVAARGTYFITDGEETIVHTTMSRNSADILYQAGVELRPSDTYTTQEHDDKLEIIVSRPLNVVVLADGKKHALTTLDKTVSEVLAALEIKLNESDRVSHELEAALYEGMVINVTRVTTKTVTYEEVLKAEDCVYLNTVMTPGTETVLEEGADGLVKKTARIICENGAEVAREIISETVITPSSDRIVIRGAESASMPSGDTGESIVTAGGEVINYSRAIDGKATAYNCPGYVGRTASGTIAEVGKVAVDPKVIPLGSKLYVVSQDGQYVYGYCIAEDTGGLIKGNKVDLYFATWDECIQFGYRPVTIYVVE